MLHRLTCLFRDLSRACIGMFERLLLHPYCTDDLWTTSHCLDMGHRNRLTILEFHLRSFLTPKNNEKIAKHSYFLSHLLKYRKGNLHRLVYLLLWTMYTIKWKGPPWHIQAKTVPLCTLLCFLGQRGCTLRKSSPRVVIKIFSGLLIKKILSSKIAFIHAHKSI